MSPARRRGHLLRPDGTNRLQRTLPGLEPEYILPDERSLADLVAYARRLAAEIRFYNLDGRAAGDWRPFLEPLLALAADHPNSNADFEAALLERRDWPPHLALYLVFLELFRHLQDDLNELPQRHLRYWYEQILRLTRRDPVADAVHVLFEPARNAAPVALEAGTPLDAGKDGLGRPLVYKTEAELVVSAAGIGAMRRLTVELDRRGRRRFFVADGIAEQEGESWHTFGRGQLGLDPGERFMGEAALGFAVASPLLRLAEGERALQLTVYLRAAEGAYPAARNIAAGLDFAFTGESGWVSPSRVEARLVDKAGEAGSPTPMAFEARLTLEPDAPPIVPLDPTLHGEGPARGLPLVRCLLRGGAGLYETLAGLRVERADLAVTVLGLRDLQVRNDQGPLAADRPMPLFGSRPCIGSAFYLASAELLGKRPTSLGLKLTWQAPPDNLLDRYRAYFAPMAGNPSGRFRVSFTADLELLCAGRWQPLATERPLFDIVTATPPPRAFEVGPAVLEAHRDCARRGVERLAATRPEARAGFLRLVLRGPARDAFAVQGSEPYAGEVPFEAFGHSAFPRVTAVRAVALSRWEASEEAPVPPDLPVEPYTPTLAELSLDYTAAAELVPGGAGTEQEWLVLGPFGYAAAGDAEAARLAPDLDGPAQGQDFSQASLFLGISGLKPPVNLSLLFQIEAGTATADQALEAGEVRWSCLQDNRWRPLSDQALLGDATLGFQQPGVIRLAIPAEAGREHTAMPTGMVWLRAALPASRDRPPQSAARTRGLHTQAVLARLEPRAGTLEDYTQHLRTGLAAGAITRLKRRNPAIGKVSQPYASFGGRVGEPDDDFFRRCSERLRHRNRAVTARDLERLVLEAFPEVFKVKCLPHSDADGVERAGEAALVIVPDLRGAHTAKPLEPRANAVLMARIAAYVRTGLASPFAALHVIHPIYEQVRVEAWVAFRSGLDAGFYSDRLRRDLRRFLSPWAYAQGRDILFGASIYKSEVLAFVEARDYVDYVTGFHLYHNHAGPPRGGIGRMTIGTDFLVWPPPRPALGEMRVGDDFVVGRDVEVARATRPHAILVSHEAHRIVPVAPEVARCAGVERLGIGYMTVGLDFEVGG
jgi:hypothetical protein